MTVLWHKGAQGLYPVIDASKELWTELVEKGFLGEKTGKGFFEYQPGEIEHIIRDRDRKLLKILNLLSEEEKKGG